MMMGASQIDQYGNTNISCIGNWNKPTSQLIGARGCPGNTINHTVSYWVTSHNQRMFVPKVDFISGVGYGGGPEFPNEAKRFVNIAIVVSPLGFFDFDEQTKRMRVKSYNKGSSVDKIVENTGFELVIPANVSETPAPTEEQLRLIREVIDPVGIRRLEVTPPKEAADLRREISSRERELMASGL